MSSGKNIETVRMRLKVVPYGLRFQVFFDFQYRLFQRKIFASAIKIQEVDVVVHAEMKYFGQIVSNAI